MNFRRLAILIVIAGSLVSVGPTKIFAASPVSPGDPQLNLYDFLSKGLKARRPQEFQYCRLIANMVEQGKLPENLVRGTFFWARQKYNRPLQYFQQALKIRAAKIGVDVPGLRSNVTTAIVSGP